MARPEIEAFKQAVGDMEEQGAATEEIEAFIDRDEDHSELNKEIEETIQIEILSFIDTIHSNKQNFIDELYDSE